MMGTRGEILVQQAYWTAVILGGVVLLMVLLSFC